MNEQGRRAQAAAAQLASGGADGLRVAEAAAAAWQQVHAALSPIVGARGVEALFKRSLSLTREAHACLADVGDPSPAHDHAASLHAVLARQTGADAAAAHAALMQTFVDLLSSLIGESLTERLLHPLLDPPSSGNAAQETP
ncbi:MAG TPA: hypothetical protein VGE16_07655 [Albitalea sp.]